MPQATQAQQFKTLSDNGAIINYLEWEEVDIYSVDPYFHAIDFPDGSKLMLDTISGDLTVPS
jgi:hypothetical protein